MTTQRICNLRNTVVSSTMLEYLKEDKNVIGIEPIETKDRQYNMYLILLITNEEIPVYVEQTFDI